MRVGIVFGTFDPLHLGHVRLLRRARQRCDRLVVAVNHAGLILLQKGRAERFPLDERMACVADLRTVDHVCVQSLTVTKAHLVAEHRATDIFCGDDWTPETFTGEGLGVPVTYLPRTPGVSSTELISARA